MNEKTLMKNITADAVEIWERAKGPLDNFLKETSKKPNPKLIKKNPFANDSSYLEIGYLEAKLDQVFMGLWEWEITGVNQLNIGFIVYGNLRVFHPVANVWITRSGIGSKAMNLKKGEEIYTPENLASKEFDKTIPAIGAEAFKNATKKLGNLFGRHLNREFKFDHAPDKDLIKRIFNERTKDFEQDPEKNTKE